MKDHKGRRPEDSGYFPGESLDLPEENPRHYQNYSNNYGQGRGVRNYNNAYGGENWQEEPQEAPWMEDDFWQEEEPREEPPEERGPERPAIRAYNADFRQDAGREPQRRREQPAQYRRREPQREESELERYSKVRQAARAEEARRPRRRKKHHFFRNLLLILLVLVLGAGGYCLLTKRMPQGGSGLGARKDGCTTILIAGLDDDALRTDTMMLLYLDSKNGEANLLSLPRDTYIGGDYSVPKLNSVYGGNGCGEEGMEALLDEIQNIVGYRPDGYVLLELEAFVDVVDAMGGVTFDVPQEMYYDDPSQNLHIDLQAGEQKLMGTDAMGLVRFRSGYAMADLRRVEVQRDFMKAAMEQWLSVGKLFRYPKALKALTAHTKTTLSVGNLLWVADALRKADLGELQTETLPGEPADIHGGSYYVLWPNATAELINESFNPYEGEITSEDLNIAG